MVFKGTNRFINDENNVFRKRNGRQKRGKKGSKRITRSDKFSGRLLWNPSGQWKDKWFLCQEGILSGYKDYGVKPADVVIDVSNCLLTSYSCDDIMRRLNVFKLTTTGGVVHIFAAWNEEQYESWVEVLSFTAQRKEDKNYMELAHLRKESEEIDDSAIIPYERALSDEQRKTNSSSSENSSELQVNNTPVVDGVDSGNDGDESGLESSVNSIKKFESRKRLEKERKHLSRSQSYNFMQETDETDGAPLDATNSPDTRGLLKLDLMTKRQDYLTKRQDSNTSTENDIMRSPELSNTDITPLSDDNIGEFKKKRSSFNYKQRWSSMFDHSKGADKKDKQFSKKVEKSQEFRKQTASCGELDLRKPKSLSLTDVSIITTTTNSTTPISITPCSDLETEFDSAHSRTGSVDSPQSFRIGSAELPTTRRRRHGSVDSNEQHWDVFDPENHIKKLSVGSEDDNSDCCSVPSVCGVPVAEEHKHDELEGTLREETFLRKRRNSLTLERGHIVNELEIVNKKGNKQETVNVMQEKQKKEKVEKLEVRLEQIDSQIEIIDKKIDLRINPTYKQKKLKPAVNKTRSSNTLMTKFRKGRQKTPMDSVYSMSVESLASNTSRDSSTGKESPVPNKQQFEDKRGLSKRISDCSETSNCSQNINSDLTGIQELLLTTQKLEYNNNNNNISENFEKGSVSPLINQPLAFSDKWRSKSVSSMDSIRTRGKIDGVKTTRRDVNQNHSSEESQLIIEDFEKFSAMLTDQMKQNRSLCDAIDV